VALLFQEDFDAPAARDAAAPEPAAAEPAPSPEPTWADVEAARGEGRLDGLREAAARDSARAAAALSAVAGSLAEMRADAVRLADETAVAVAKMLMASLAAALPEVCRRHGPTEVAALVRMVMPALRYEPAVRVLANSEVVPLLQHEIAQLTEEFEGSVTVEASPKMAVGDVEVRWLNAKAFRNTDTICAELIEILENPPMPPDTGGEPPWFGAEGGPWRRAQAQRAEEAAAAEAQREAEAAHAARAGPAAEPHHVSETRDASATQHIPDTTAEREVAHVE